MAMGIVPWGLADWDDHGIHIFQQPQSCIGYDDNDIFYGVELLACLHHACIQTIDCLSANKP